MKYFKIILSIILIYIIYIVFFIVYQNVYKDYTIKIYSEEKIPIFFHNEEKKSFILDYNYESISLKLFPFRIPLFHKIHGFIIKIFYPDIILKILSKQKYNQYDQFFPGFYFLNCYKKKNCDETFIESDFLEIQTFLSHKWTQQIKKILNYELQQLDDNDTLFSSVIIIQKNDDYNLLRVITNSSNKIYYDTFTKVRLAGSTLKPFLYALAFEKLKYEPDTIIEDEPIYFYDEMNRVLYFPKNHDNQYLGKITIKEALGNSRNIPAVSLLQKITVDSFYQFLKEAGISHLKSLNEYNLSIALGTSGITQIQLANLYTLLFQNGKLKPLVVGYKGDLPVYLTMDHKLTTKQVQTKVLFNTETIVKINQILKDNDLRRISFGKRNYTDFNFPVIAKTGTSYNYRDSWIVGIVGDLLICVWVGKLKEEPMNGISGIRGAGRIFYQIVRNLKQTKDFHREPILFNEYNHSNVLQEEESKECKIVFPLNKQKIFLNPAKENSLIIQIKCNKNYNIDIFKDDFHIQKEEQLKDKTYFKIYPIKSGNYKIVLSTSNETQVTTFRVIE